MTRTDITPLLTGLSSSLQTIYQQIGDSGWSVSKVHFDKKKDQYVAIAKNSRGEKIEKFGPNEQQAVLHLYMAIQRHNHIRTAAQIKVGMWKTMFTDQQAAIAAAYAKAPLYDPRAAGAFKALADDSTRRAAVLRQQLKIEVTNNPEPYSSAQEMAEDIHKRRHFVVSRANSEHPVWTPDQNVAFRIVHDVLGHAVSGGDFGWVGENLACAAHFPLLSNEAQGALFSECLGQTAYSGQYRSFGPQKVALFPEFYEAVQKQEGHGPNYQGVHPSQSVAPAEMPSVSPSPSYDESSGLPSGTIAPHQEALGLTPLMSPALPGVDHRYPSPYFARVAAYDPSLVDPNAGYQTGVEPLANNAYTRGGDPFQKQAVSDNASLIDTKWAKLNQEDPGELAQMKQAIVNAFRVVLLSPRKDLRWNAIHYQDIASIPGDVSDPTVYWRTLEKHRQEWNVQRFGEGARFSHRPYHKLIPALTNIIYRQNPTLGHQAVTDKVESLLFNWQTEEQEKIEAEDAGRPEEKQKDHYEIDNLAIKALTERIKLYIEASKQPESGQEQLGFDHFGAKPKQEDGLFELDDRSRYGAFMGGHLKSISQVSRHVDGIMKAALEDVDAHDGAGHHFRSYVLQQQIKGVGPKVCSFAWLLLQPMTSQLATIDTHMLDVLGYAEKDMNHRNYFKFERQLQAGRDAAGYSGVPLGQFQWGMWDLKRTGEGSHQDHSAMRVLDPTPHDAVPWAAKANNIKGESWGQVAAPDWWNDTLEARQRVGNQYDQTIGKGFTQGQIPYQQGANDPTQNPTQTTLSAHSSISPGTSGEERTPQATPAPIRTPWIVPPGSTERVLGRPGDTIMRHATRLLGLGTPEVWASMAQAGKEEQHQPVPVTNQS